MTPKEFQDFLEEVIADSIEPDWSPRSAAAHILENLKPENPNWRLGRISFEWRTND